MPTRSSVLAWRIPWTEEPGGLQCMGSQRVGHDRAADTFTQGRSTGTRPACGRREGPCGEQREGVSGQCMQL